MRLGGPVRAALAAIVALSVVPTGSGAQDSSGSVSSVEISADGAQIYVEACQACHLAGGTGGAGAGTGIPALAGNARLADKTYAINIMVHGRGGMPWFTDLLEPAQIAAVLTYVRSELNDYPDPVTEAEIAPLALAATAARGEE